MASPTVVVTPAYPYLELEFTIGAFRSPIITLLGEEYLVGRGIVDHLRMTFDHGQRLLVET